MSLSRNMNRQKFDGRTIVYSYGVRQRADVDDATIDQMRKANQLWNVCVELDRCAESERADVEQRDDNVARLTAEVASTEAEILAASEAIKAWKVANRTAKNVPFELRNAKSVTHQRLRELRTKLKVARATYRLEVKPALDAIEVRRVQAINDARRAASADGLHWGTYGLVLESFAVARDRMLKSRMRGEPSELHFHRFTGEGTVRSQVMRQAGDPVRDPATLPTSKWRNVVKLPHIADAEWDAMSKVQRKTWARSQRAAIRIGSDDTGEAIWCELPVVWHRPIPDGADVCYVSVTRRLIAGKPEVSVNVTVRLPKAIPSRQAATAAVDLGWRSRPGSIRVAVIAADTELPDCPSTWVRRLPGGEWEVVVPQSMIDRDRKVSDLQSIRQRLFNEMLPVAVAFLRAHPAVAERLHVDVAHMHQWKSIRRLVGLVARWRDGDSGEGEAIVVAQLEAWRHQDKHLWSWEQHQAAGIAATRREQWRIVAAWLTANVGRVVVEDFNVKQMVAGPAGDDSDDNREQNAAMRSQARLASPGLLRLTLKVAADGRGVAFDPRDPAWSSSFHRDCGGEFNRDDLRISIIVACPTCSEDVDQDVNAAWMLLDTSGPTTAQSAGTARMLNEQARYADNATA